MHALVQAAPGAAAVADVRLIPLTSGELLVLWVQLAALLVVARACGALARRLGQPGVVGYLVAGLLLGPSVLGHLWPGAFDLFLPDHDPVQSGILAGMINFSLAILLIVIGAETDIPLIRKLGRPATTVSIGSLVLPLGVGFVAGALLPPALSGSSGRPWYFAAFVALTVAISSLPIIAKIVTDMGLTRRNFGQLAFAVGTVNDTFGFLALAVLAALVGAGESSAHPLWVTFAGLALFLLFVTVAGQRTIDFFLRRLRSRDPEAEMPFAWGSLSGVVIFALVMAALTQAIGVEGSLGAFLAGLLVGRSRFAQEGTFRRLEGMSEAVFAPLYFAAAGLRVDAGTLGSAPALIALAALIAVALGSKFAGVYLGSRWSHQPAREGVALGIGLNGRGALQVIIATAALGAGIFDQTSFSLVILMSIATSMITPLLLRRAMHGWEGTPEERRRLAHEAKLRGNVIIRGGRILLPSRGTTNSMTAAFVLNLVWPEDEPVTLLSVGSAEVKSATLQTVADLMYPRDVERRHVGSPDLLDELLAESRLGYGIIGVGVSGDAEQALLGPAVDHLLRHTPLPVLIVRRGKGIDAHGPLAFHRILIPVSGDETARGAKEVGFTLSAALDADTSVVHVLTRSSGGNGLAGARARDVVEQARALAGDYEVETTTRVARGGSPGDQIVEEADRARADVIVMGAAVRIVDDRPFLGHTVEHVLEEAPQTVLVVALPPRT